MWMLTADSKFKRFMRERIILPQFLDEDPIGFDRNGKDTLRNSSSKKKKKKDDDDES